ncbi:MAG TPA: LysR family transcriptional regulator, partial [Burkholderiales bacterium]
MMNVSELDLNLLRAFDAVLREGSVTAAGGRLGLSQPAMSNAISRLRRLLEDPLFVRTPRGVRPTPFAQRLAAPVRQALELIHSALSQQSGFDPGTSERVFRLQLTDVGELVFLPSLLERLKREAPRVRIEVEQRRQGDVGDALAAGEIDLALGFLPELSAGVMQKRLFRDQYVCLMRAEHPAIGARLTLARFLAAAHVLVSAEGSPHQIVEQTLRAKGLRRQIALRVPHFMVIPMILARTDYMAIVPKGFVHAMAPLGRYRSLKLPVDIPELDVKLHWHERFNRDPGISWLRGVLIDLYSE